MSAHCLPMNRVNRDFFGYPEEYDEERFRQFIRDLTGHRRHRLSYREAFDLAEEHFDRDSRITFPPAR
jgi:hypothetical protein